ncbi:MAG: hypothetical protein Q8M16_08195 [Pirellulaceae bacterium]|nr:hypothetical protein [Pirellulaceae bacterium]
MKRHSAQKIGNFRRLVLPVAFLMLAPFWFATDANGQMTVQLPQFRRFQVNGSIMVPDRGSAFMGGVSGSGIGSRQYGALPIRPFANRSTGGNFDNAVVVTSVEVFSLRDMEAQLMGQLSPEYREQLAVESAAAEQRVERQLAADQAKFRQLRQQQADEKVALAKEDVRWARKFAAEGNHLAADMYYQQAIKSLPPDLAGLAEKEHRSYRASRSDR